MLLRELFVQTEIDEAVKAIWSRSGGKQVRKYRCPLFYLQLFLWAFFASCNAPINQKAKVTLSKTKRKKGSRSGIKTAKTKRANPASRR